MFLLLTSKYLHMAVQHNDCFCLYINRQRLDFLLHSKLSSNTTTINFHFIYFIFILQISSRLILDMISINILFHFIR